MRFLPPLVLFIATLASGAELPPPADKQIDFARDIDPVLSARCYACHGEDVTMNGYSMWRKKEALRGGYSGLPSIVPGDSAGSRMIRLVAGMEENLTMPPAGGSLTDEEIGLLRAWIDQGVVWDTTRIDAPKLSEEKPWLKMDYGPVISASVTVREPEDPRADKGPDDNIAYKAHAIALTPEKDATIVFDTELLRYSAGWTGGFLVLTGTVFDWTHGPHPYADGSAAFETRVAPGWARDESFNDPRPSGFGPLPADWAKYRGRYVHGDKTVLSYSVGGTGVLDLPSFARRGDVEVFTRTLEIEPSKEDLLLVVAAEDGEEASALDSVPRGAQLGELSAAVVGAEAEWVLDRPDELALRIPASPKTRLIAIHLAREADTAKFAEYLKENSRPDPVAPYAKGGPTRFPQIVETSGKLGDESGPWAVDEITLPFDNPWRSWMRPGDFDFFADDRAVLTTWSGDVFIVSGVEGDLSRLRWKRFATGFYQPLGVEVVDDVVYVLDRNQITRLHDLNGDGEADYYENFFNDFEATHHFHEFTFDLDRDAAGNFYFAKAARHALPAKVKHHGVILKLDPSGRNAEVLCNGFRVPNGVAVSPSGEVTTSDQEGHWIPSTRVNWCKPGSFHGNMWSGGVDPDRKDYDPPIAFLPISVDNSGAGQAWTPDERWGLPAGSLIHTTFGRGKAFLMLMENAGGVVQGGAVELPLDFDSGLMRPDFRESDGQLYLCGLYGWGTKRKAVGGFYRARYTGKPFHLPVRLHAGRAGIQIGFSQELDRAAAERAGNYKVRRWNYKWTSRYGSDLFKLNGEQGTEPVKVRSAKLLEGGRSVLLELEDLREVMQMQIVYDIKAADGTTVSGELHNTVTTLPVQRGETVFAQ